MDASDVEFYFSAEFSQRRTARLLRSFANFGFPLEGYADAFDRASEQKAVFQSWVDDVLAPFLEGYEDENVRVLYYEDYLIKEQWTRSVFVFTRVEY